MKAAKRCINNVVEHDEIRTPKTDEERKRRYKRLTLKNGLEILLVSDGTLLGGGGDEDGCDEDDASISSSSSSSFEEDDDDDDDDD